MDLEIPWTFSVTQALNDRKLCGHIKGSTSRAEAENQTTTLVFTAYIAKVNFIFLVVLFLSLGFPSTLMYTLISTFQPQNKASAFFL